MSDWISVKERLPEPWTQVIGILPDGGFRVTWTYYDGSWWDSGITHWMPLPDPPKE